MRIRGVGPIQPEHLGLIVLMRAPLRLQFRECPWILGHDVPAAYKIHAVQSVLLVDLVIDLREAIIGPEYAFQAYAGGSSRRGVRGKQTSRAHRRSGGICL